MQLLVPETGLLFWMTLSFGVVLFVLIRYGFPVILGAVDKRREYISESLSKAEQAELRLAEADQQVQQLIDGAHKERLTIVRQGEKDAAGLVEKAKAQAMEQSRRILSDADAEAGNIKKRAMADARASVASLSVKIAGKVLERELEQDGKQRELLDRLLDKEGI